MYLETLEYTKEESEESYKKNKEVKFKSKLTFLSGHNGIRDKKMHLLIAPTHAGKSTLIRSMLFDILTNNKGKKILLWLTEETIQEFKDEFCKAFPAHSILSNVAVVSEQNGNPTPDEVKANILEAIGMVEPDLLFIDNITTSRTYNKGGFFAQQETADWLKTLSKQLPLFMVAHTNTSDFNNRFLTEQDIRGGKDIINLTEFLYILQPITIGETLFQFINLKKHRGQKVSGKFFRLYYNPALSIFDRDTVINFNDIKDFFKQRNKLADR